MHFLGPTEIQKRGDFAHHIFLMKIAARFHSISRLDNLRSVSNLCSLQNTDMGWQRLAAQYQRSSDTNEMKNHIRDKKTDERKCLSFLSAPFRWEKALDGGVAQIIKVIDTQSPASAFPALSSYTCSADDKNHH